MTYLFYISFKLPIFSLVLSISTLLVHLDEIYFIPLSNKRKQQIYKDIAFMAKLEAKTKENPKLHQSTLSDGRISLYLEYYLGRSQWIDQETGKTKVKHDRKKETLNMYLISNPRTPVERQTNKEILELAKEIRTEREQELKKDRTGKRIFKIKSVNFLEYFQGYINS